MAIYHLSAQMVKRSEKRSSIAMSAYRSGQKLIDEATGLIKDYTAKTKIFMSEILAPEKSPSWVFNRQELWNSVEKTEKRKDAQLARELNIALPQELDHEQMHQLVNSYMQDQFVKSGMIADVAYHNLDTDNPHFHVMLTTRRIEGDSFGKKAREWNEKDLLKHWRQTWQEYANRALEQAGSNSRIDHRSLAAQNIAREPQIHLGPKPHPRRINQNKAIIKRNSERQVVEDEPKNIDKPQPREISRRQGTPRTKEQVKPKEQPRKGFFNIVKDKIKSLFIKDEEPEAIRAPSARNPAVVEKPNQEAKKRNDISFSKHWRKTSREQLNGDPGQTGGRQEAPQTKPKEQPKKGFFNTVKDKIKYLFIKDEETEVIKAPTGENPAAEEKPKNQAKEEPRDIPPSKKELQAEHDKQCRFLADVMHLNKSLRYDRNLINEWSDIDREAWEVEKGYRQSEKTSRPGQYKSLDRDDDRPTRPRR